MIELDFDPQTPKYQLIEKQSEVKSAVQQLAAHRILALDTEGTSLDPHDTKLLLLQVAIPEKAFLFAVQKVNLELLKPLLEDNQKLKIVQNGKFDYEMIKVNLGMEIKNIFDTMLAERLLTAGLTRENSLEALAKKYLEIELEKEVRDTFGRIGQLSKKQLEYAALDVLVLFPIFKKQYARLREEKLLKVAQLEFSVLPVVAEMEIKGSYIDKKKWRAHIAQLREKRDLVAGQIQEDLRPLYQNNQVDLFGQSVDVVNLNSPVQILEAFRKVGVELPSTGVSVLKRTDHRLAKKLLEYRGYEKLISAFGESVLEKTHPKTGRIHPDFMQIGADTGRFSCSKPNLQQIPKDSAFRSCFTAPEGYKLVVADYSQAELRILAEYSEDPVFMKAYKEDKDLHTLTASQMYGVPMEKVDKKMRFNAKSINFGLMYGRGAASLAAQLGVSVDEAKKLLNKYFKTYNKVQRWLDRVAKEAVSKGYSTTLSGRKRWYNLPDKSDPFYDRLIANIERQGKNTPIQGTSADMTKYALVYVYQRVRKEGFEAYPIHTVHDEIVLEAREDQAEEVCQVLSEEMGRAARVLLKKVPVKADAMVSDFWEH
jgi:DNA polymerase-1